ncbi:hypothetical protein SBOR_5636 [Sclerotinia borealis F-4128]|uniref:Uncharacterized protein n=1 Tax=Sclerotinia borealis (strain F-4128) TaxID=1432307 RepID=W9CDM8_SCLBF|nr:hypothetical protein SBOR_5636 [Sclerotinia borealis F-4128]
MYEQEILKGLNLFIQNYERRIRIETYIKDGLRKDQLIDPNGPTVDKLSESSIVDRMRVEAPPRRAWVEPPVVNEPLNRSALIRATKAAKTAKAKPTQPSSHVEADVSSLTLSRHFFRLSTNISHSARSDTISVTERAKRAGRAKQVAGLGTIPDIVENVV